MTNVLGTLVDKVNSMQGQMSNGSRGIEILESNHKEMQEI
jgi:hypothetical protein